MRFLRMFTNALLAGGLGAAYLTVLVLQVNPDVPLLSGTTLRWFVTLAVSYGPQVAAVFYAVLLVRDFFSIDPLSPGWASVRVLAWLAAATAGAAATLMWLNASAFRAVLGEIATRRMMAGALATTAAAVVLLAIAIVHYSYGRRGSRVGAALFALAVLGSLVLPVAARGPAIPRRAAVPVEQASPAAADARRSPRLVLLLLDGASLEYIRARTAEGPLANFSRLLDSGASMYLATIRPTQPAPVWAATATGMYPAKNGVRSAAAYYALGDSRPVALLPDHCFSHALVRFGIVRTTAQTSEAWESRPLWDILSHAGITAGIVRWPLTYPARPVDGFLLSDRIHHLAAAPAELDARAAYPPGVLDERFLRLTDLAGDDQPLPADGGSPAGAAHDRLYSRAMRELQARRDPQVVALRLQAIDTAGHHHYHDGGPVPFREEADDGERRSGAQQLERAYADVDAEVGLALDRLEPGDLLLVVSGFGMQRLHPLKELLARVLGDDRLRGSHERAPDGFLIAYGTPVHPGRLPRGSIVDVTPTVLYFLGVPIGRDMDGFARTDLFTSDFTAERPIAFISTHNR